MILRILVLLLVASPALSQETKSEGSMRERPVYVPYDYPYGNRAPDTSIPSFDHAPGQQDSIPPQGPIPAPGPQPGPSSIPGR